MAADQLTGSGLISKTPGVCGGDACLAHRRIPIWQLVESRRNGTSDEVLKQVFMPPVTQEELDAAWAYFEDNSAEIEVAIRENELAMYEDV